MTRAVRACQPLVQGSSPDPPHGVVAFLFQDAPAKKLARGWLPQERRPVRHRQAGEDVHESPCFPCVHHMGIKCKKWEEMRKIGSYRSNEKETSFSKQNGKLVLTSRCYSLFPH